MDIHHLRNVAIIAHVDHGKTTLVDGLLYESGMFRDAELDKLAGGQHGLIMDTGELERERGITITAKLCSIRYRVGAMDGGTQAQSREGTKRAGADSDATGPAEYKINLVDTPGHADFGGEVERVLKMADGVLLLVDAFEGPMPQTRFVLQKALEHGLRPVVVVNKVDKPNARPDDVVNEVFDLLVALDAPDAALDFPVVYASAKEGWAVRHLGDEKTSLRPLVETIIERLPSPADAVNRRSDALQMQVTTIDYSDYVGRIAIGRVHGGVLKPAMPVAVAHPGREPMNQKTLKVMTFEGLGRVEVDAVPAGELCAVVGLDPIEIGDTIADRAAPTALPTVKIDEPTLSMAFQVNDAPFAGREGKFVTGRQVWDRLQKELRSNVALRVARGEAGESYTVSGRGLMHIGVLLETMRREGYELCVGKPQVIEREIDGVRCEPIEQLVVDCPSDCQNEVLSLVTPRRAEVVSMDAKSGAGEYVHLVFTLPARGLIGLRTRMLTATQGRAIMHHNLIGYEPVRGEVPGRAAGVMIASDPGQVTAYSLDRLYDRGVFFVRPGDQIYEGQVVGEHCKDNDITVNLAINKKLSNMRATGSDDATRVKPAREMSLEACLEYIEDDELVELTPKSIRLRKRALKESDRRRETRRARDRAAAVVG
jgi:GTP-binding protein